MRFCHCCQIVRIYINFLNVTLGWYITCQSADCSGSFKVYYMTWSSYELQKPNENRTSIIVLVVWWINRPVVNCNGEINVRPWLACMIAWQIEITVITWQPLLDKRVNICVGDVLFPQSQLSLHKSNNVWDNHNNRLNLYVWLSLPMQHSHLLDEPFLYCLPLWQLSCT